MSEQIEMKTFDEFKLIDDCDIQIILRQVDKVSLSYAMITYPDTAPRFFENMSCRAAKIMEEDMRAIGNIRTSDGEKHAQTIVDTFNELLANGEVTLRLVGEGLSHYTKPDGLMSHEYKLLCESILDLSRTGSTKYFTGWMSCSKITKLIESAIYNNSPSDSDNFDELD